jgi:SagB-type dehydrogenase family enzyme
MENSKLLQLSNYVILRNSEDCMMLEQPVSGFSVPIRKPAILQLLFNFIKPANPAEYLNKQNPSIQFELNKLITFLREKSVLVEPQNNDSANLKPLDFWQFHDLYFHTQSRRGSNLNKLGATYRFGDEENTEGHLRRKMWKGKKIDLPENPLNVGNTEPVTLSEALEKRTTSYRTSALNLDILSAFLGKSLRVKKIEKDNFNHSYVKKFYPSGGSLHSIEAYLAIYNCSGLANGFYYYDASEHSLVEIPNKEKLLDSILENAQSAMGRNDLPAAVVVFSSRFERVFWKYESLGYRLILLELGTIFQTLYLLAAGLNLSVCALGSGNSTEFSENLNLDYFEETSIGEFVINGIL